MSEFRFIYPLLYGKVFQRIVKAGTLHTAFDIYIRLHHRGAGPTVAIWRGSHLVGQIVEVWNPDKGTMEPTLKPIGA